MQDGSISIQVYFRKEMSPPFSDHGKEQVFDVGRIITVVKDNGTGIDEVT